MCSLLHDEREPKKVLTKNEIGTVESLALSSEANAKKNKVLQFFDPNVGSIEVQNMINGIYQPFCTGCQKVSLDIFLDSILGPI